MNVLRFLRPICYLKLKFRPYKDFDKTAIKVRQKKPLCQNSSRSTHANIYREKFFNHMNGRSRYKSVIHFSVQDKGSLPTTLKLLPDFNTNLYLHVSSALSQLSPIFVMPGASRDRCEHVNCDQLVF